MKKTQISKRGKRTSDNLKPHYDFDYSKAKPNRFAKTRDGQPVYRENFKVTIHKADGSTITRLVKSSGDVITLEPDVRTYFPDSESVNAALRGLIALVPHKRRTRPQARS